MSRIAAKLQNRTTVALRRLLVSVLSRSQNDSPYGYSTALIVTLITFEDCKLFKINRVWDYWPLSLQSRTTCQCERPHDDGRVFFLFINITSHTRSLFETNSDQNNNCNRPRWRLLGLYIPQLVIFFLKSHHGQLWIFASFQDRSCLAEITVVLAGSTMSWQDHAGNRNSRRDSRQDPGQDFFLPRSR